MFRKLREFAVVTVLAPGAIVAEFGVANALPFFPSNTAVETQPNEVIPVQFMHYRRTG